MATVSVRGRFWRARVRRGGVSYSKTFDTEREARAWADDEDGRLARGDRPEPSPLRCRDLFDRYAKEVSPGKGGARWEVIRLRRFCAEFSGLAIEIDGPALADWRDGRLKVVSAASVNRDLNLLGAVFTRAIKEWRIGLTINPVHQIQRPRQPGHRSRRVPDAELAAVIHELGWHDDKAPADLREWVAWTAAFAVETAMRRGEILGMEWRHVHDRHVHLPRTKNGLPRNVPLSSRARSLVGLLQRGDDRVVPVNAGTHLAYWKDAAVGAGAVDLHFHDLRHEATTRMAPKFRDALELSKVTGHRDLRALSGYYHPDVVDLADKLG